MNENLLRGYIRKLLFEVGNLSASEMKNRAYRWDVFLRKMKNSEPFEDVLNNQFVIPIEGNDELIQALIDKDPYAYKLAFKNGVKTNPPNMILSPAKLKKTVEFGGLTPGGRLKKEQMQIKQIQDAINEKAPVDIYVGRKTAKDVVGIKDVIGTPKADAYFVNSQNEPVAMISLKYADEPTQMQQWGGIGKYVNHPEINSFINDLKAIQDMSESGRITVAYYRILKDEALAKELCYGDMSNEKNDCDLIIASQSPIEINELGEIVASNVFYAPEIPSGDWYPTLWATYRSGRGTGLGLKDIRVGCYPKAWGSTRKNMELPFLASIENDIGPDDNDEISERLIKRIVQEALTRSDENRVQSLARQVAKEEMRKAFGGGTFKQAIETEIIKALGKRATKQEIAEITKAVLIKLYRELSYSYRPVIDRIKV